MRLSFKFKWRFVGQHGQLNAFRLWRSVFHLNESAFRFGSEMAWDSQVPFSCSVKKKLIFPCLSGRDRKEWDQIEQNRNSKTLITFFLGVRVEQVFQWYDDRHERSQFYHCPSTPYPSLGLQRKCPAILVSMRIASTFYSLFIPFTVQGQCFRREAQENWEANTSLRKWTQRVAAHIHVWILTDR
jgi:hypothetical protein